VAIVGEVEVVVRAVVVTDPILPGSIVLIPEAMVDLGDEDAEDWAAARAERHREMMDLLVEKAGRRRFVVMLVPEGTPALGVLDPDEARAMVRQLVAEILEER
jgi:hypothetical protein